MRKWHLVICKDANVSENRPGNESQHILMMKGAPEVLIKRCSTYRSNSGIEKINDDFYSDFQDTYLRFGKEGANFNYINFNILINIQILTLKALKISGKIFSYTKLPQSSITKSKNAWILAKLRNARPYFLCMHTINQKPLIFSNSAKNQQFSPKIVKGNSGLFKFCLKNFQNVAKITKKWWKIRKFSRFIEYFFKEISGNILGKFPSFQHYNCFDKIWQFWFFLKAVA